MENFKEYIAKQFIGKKLKFKCDCIIPIDSVGVIKGFNMYNNEIIFSVMIGNKIISIGENHPNLKVEEI